MPKHEFLPILFENFWAYISIWASVFIVLSLIILKFTKSVIDPLYFSYAFNYSFAICAVIFLFFIGLVSVNLLVYFALAQILFVIGFVSFRPMLENKRYVLASDEGFIAFSYYCLSLVLVAFTAITYLYFGIPVLESSRWELYNEIPGAGLIGRTIDVSEFFIIFWLTVKALSSESRLTLFDRFMIVVLLVTAVLSGSKMTILTYLFISYASYLFASNVRPLKKLKFNGMVLVAVVSAISLALIISYLHQLYVNDVRLNPIFLILGRLVMSGDLQIMAYPNNVLANINSSGGLLDIFFHDFKGILRIIGIDDEAKSLGLEVMHYHYPHLVDLNMGPASTFETFYFFHFGFWPGLAFSLLSGLILGFSYFRRGKVRSYKEAAFGAYGFLCALTIILNPQIALGKFAFFAISFIFVYFVYCFLLDISRVYRGDE